MKKINKIVFLGDLLRYQEEAHFFADRSLGWMYFLFKEQINSATGCDVEVCYAKDKNKFDRDLFYDLCGFNEVNFDNWLKITSGKITDEAVDYIKKCFQECLIIFQVAGALKAVLEKAEIPFIDIYISAIKFMENLHFAGRSNIPKITEKLKEYRLAEDNIKYNANVVKSYYFARNCLNNYSPNSLLLCGQTEVDLSLVKDGKLVSFLDYQEKIKKITKIYSKVYYKPHPYSNPNSKSEKFIRSFENIELINDNFYQMISSDSISAVAALSSGTLKEAEYFGKKIHTISHSFVNYYKGDCEIQKDDFIILHDDYFSPTFWADILSPIIETKKCDYFNFQNRNNLLRNTLNVWWGYEIGSPIDLNLAMEKTRAEILNQNLATFEQINSLQNEVNQIQRPHRTLMHLLSHFIPVKKWRKKLRGDND